MMDSGIPRDQSATQRPRQPQPQRDPGRDDVRKLIADLMPWAATILIHGAMVLIAILIVWATLDKTEVETPVIPVISNAKEDRGRVKLRSDRTPVNPQTGGDRPAPLEHKRKTTEAVKVEVPLIGNTGFTSDKESTFAPGGGEVGEGTIFGDGPTGATKGANSFAFVIDASGSMIDTLPFVVAELKKTLRTMSSKHQFTVIFYQNDTVIEALTPGLKQATPENIESAMDWLDGDALSPAGRSSPVKAIVAALRHKPEVMFLLSDNITGRGQYEIHQRGLLDEIKRANSARTKINTIQFLYPDPLSKIPGMKPTMQMISEESGGIYKFVTARELGL